MVLYLSLYPAGVIFEEDELTVWAKEMPGFVENRMMHEIMFNFSATVHSTSTTITAGDALWMVQVYGSTNDTGEGHRYSETQISFDGSSDVIPGELVAYSGLWELDLTNFTCPESEDFYMCVVLMPGTSPTPMFSMRPRSGLRGCTPIDCTGELDRLARSSEYFQSKCPSNRSSADENIGFNCTCDASWPAVVENVQWRLRAVYLDALTIGLQGRHWTIQAFEHFGFIARL